MKGPFLVATALGLGAFYFMAGKAKAVPAFVGRTHMLFFEGVGDNESVELLELLESQGSVTGFEHSLTGDLQVNWKPFSERSRQVGLAGIAPRLSVDPVLV